MGTVRAVRAGGATFLVHPDLRVTTSDGAGVPDETAGMVRDMLEQDELTASLTSARLAGVHTVPYPLTGEGREESPQGMYKRAAAGVRSAMMRRAESWKRRGDLLTSLGGEFSDRQVVVAPADGLIYVSSRSHYNETSGTWEKPAEQGFTCFAVAPQDLEALCMRAEEAEWHAELTRLHQAAWDAPDSHTRDRDSFTLPDGRNCGYSYHDLHGANFCPEDGAPIAATGHFYYLEDRIAESRRRAPDFPRPAAPGQKVLLRKPSNKGRDASGFGA